MPHLLFQLLPLDPALRVALTILAFNLVFQGWCNNKLPLAESWSICTQWERGLLTPEIGSFRVLDTSFHPSPRSWNLGLVNKMQGKHVWRRILSPPCPSPVERGASLSHGVCRQLGDRGSLHDPCFSMWWKVQGHTLLLYPRLKAVRPFLLDSKTSSQKSDPVSEISGIKPETRGHLYEIIIEGCCPTAWCISDIKRGKLGGKQGQHTENIVELSQCAFSVC